MIFCIETYLSFQFYIKEPDFPIGIFAIDALNAIFRDLLLASIFMFIQKHFNSVKQVAKDYCPIVIVALLWIVVSITITNSLKLIFNVITVISILTGIINNTIFVLLAGYIYTKLKNTLSKTIYFFTYSFTILFFYVDTIYFLVTSTHIEKMVFENLNNYSITGVVYSADKTILITILISFCFFMLIFRTPKKSDNFLQKNFGATAIIILCILINFVNLTIVNAYPKALLAAGFDEESEIEKSRNLTRNMLSKSVTINLIQEFFGNETKHVTATSQVQRVTFSEHEIELLSELGIEVDKKTTSTNKVFPYEKIIVIVAESFHRDYLHYYNPQIPAETTQFLDSLVAKYPHSDHYYTSNKPTNQGLNSMFLSQLIYSDEQSYEDNVTLFKTLANNGYETLFLEATSQYYNDEFRAYKKRFGMHIYRAKEDLEKQGYIGSSGWGFHNDVMYQETIRILEQNRNNKFFMVTKTIDSHQPYPYCGLSDEDIPASIKDENKNLYLKAIYWENISLQKFFHDLKERNLMDDKTLIIVTSDHNPHPSQNDHYKRLGQKELGASLAPVPLIFISTNLQPFNNFSSATYTCQIDFAPTLLEILGIPSPPEFSGKNMINVPEERSYAVGFSWGTVHYWSKDQQIKTDMYNNKVENAYEKALIHWIQDLYVRYFYANSVTASQ